MVVKSNTPHPPSAPQWLWAEFKGSQTANAIVSYLAEAHADLRKLTFTVEEEA